MSNTNYLHGDTSIILMDYLGNKLCDLLIPNYNLQGCAYSILLKESISGMKELSMIVPPKIMDEEGNPIDNFRWEYLKNELLIKLTEPDTTESDIFIIKGLEDVRDDQGVLMSNVQAVLISNELSKKGFDKQIEKTGVASEILSLILADSGWTIGTCDPFYQDEEETIVKVRTMKATRSNVLDMLNELCTLFEGFIKYNCESKTVDFRATIGENKGFQFRYRKNLQNVNRKFDTNNLCTRLFCAGGSDINGLPVGIEQYNPTGENYIDRLDYYLSFMSQEQEDAIAEYETDITDINTLISATLSSLSDLEEQKWQKDKDLQAAKVILSAKVGEKEKLETLLSAETDPDEKADIQSLIDALTTEISTLSGEVTTLETDIADIEEDIDDLEYTLENQQSQKETIKSNYKLLMGDFLKEGIYEDSQQISGEALYKDALKLIEKVSIPRVEYTLSAINLQLLEGYENEKFGIADIVEINDESLHIEKAYVRITDIERYIDRPQEVSITICNWKNDFDEYFKKLTRSSEIFTANKDMYERAGWFDGSGTINSDVLNATFANNRIKIYASKNNDVIIDEEGITTIDLDSPNLVTRVIGGMVAVSNDGGETYKQALNGEGISTELLRAGSIDVEKITILGKTSPLFHWNRLGLHAISQNLDGTANLDKWIRFNQQGFLFTKTNGATYDSGWTWDGFFIGEKSGNDIVNAVDTTNQNVLDIQAANTEISNLGSRVDSVEFSVSPAQIVLAVRSSEEYIGDINSLVDSIDGLDTRLQSAELTIQPSSIIATVTESQTYINDLGGLASDISNLDSRIQTAELAIEPSAIVATVRNSTSYINDLADKASVSQLNIEKAKISMLVEEVEGENVIKTASIVTAINDSSSGIMLNADKINLVGAVTVLSDITGNLGSITAGDITGTTITGCTIKSSSDVSRIEFDAYGISGYESGVIRQSLDTSGHTFYYGGQVGLQINSSGLNFRELGLDYGDIIRYSYAGYRGLYIGGYNGLELAAGSNAMITMADGGSYPGITISCGGHSIAVNPGGVYVDGVKVSV